MRSSEITVVRGGVWAIIVAGAVVLGGCARTPARTDLLGAEVALTPCEEDRGLLWWEAPGFSWHDYDRVMLEPVAVKMDRRSSGETVTRAGRRARSSR